MNALSCQKLCLLTEYLTSFEVVFFCMHTLNDKMSSWNLLIAKVKARCVIQSSFLHFSLIKQINYLRGGKHQIRTYKSDFTLFCYIEQVMVNHELFFEYISFREKK